MYNWTTTSMMNVTEEALSSLLSVKDEAQDSNPSVKALHPGNTPEHGEGSLALLPLPALLVLTPLMLSLIAISVGSNLLVLLSYKPHMLFVDAQSLYLLHLAVSDLLISVVCMPLHLISTLWSAGWPLGRVMCRLYSAVQLTLLNVTTLVLVLVALDGLLQAEEGVRSTGLEAKRKAHAWLALCWLLAVAVHVPGTFSWGVLLQGHSSSSHNVCRPAFYNSLAHVLFVQLWSFFLPVLVLSIINTRLYLRLRRLSLTMLTFGNVFPRRLVSGGGDPGVHHKETLETRDRMALSDTNTAGGELHDIAMVSLQPPDAQPAQKQATKSSVSQALYTDWPPLKSQSFSSAGMSARSLSTGQIGKMTTASRGAGKRFDRTPRAGKDNRRSRSSNDIKIPVSPKLNTKMAASTELASGSEPQRSSAAGDGGGRGENSGASKAGYLAARSRHVSLDRPYRLKRVAVILFTLVLILVLCWLPYSVAFLVRSVCQDCINPFVYSVLVWVLYFKCCINPFLYAYNTFAFRNRFRRLLVRVFPVKRLRRMTTDRVSNERASILN